MMTRTIICQRCGTEGEIKGQGQKSDTPPAHIFRYRGHNPYSGDLHYQCPVCEIVLLVDPMSVLEGLISGHPSVAAKRTGGTKNGRRDQGESLLRRLFQNQPNGSC
jgi:hypothetical protein